MLYLQGRSVIAIQRRLQEENQSISLQSLFKLFRKYKHYHTYVDLPRKAVPKKITPEMMIRIDELLNENDELTSRQIRTSLKEQYPGLEVSLPTIKRARKEAGWTSTKPHYCQLIRQVAKQF